MEDHRPPPYQHQVDELVKRAEVPAWALFWDCGTGKTRAILDLAGALWHRREINGLLVLAPNGVHQGWVYDEIPKHLPPGIAFEAHAYRGSSAGAKWHKKTIEALIDNGSERTRKRLAILTMSYDSFVTKTGRAAAKQFLTRRRCLYVLDESHLVKTPGARRTKLVISSGRLAPYRRILTGTPVANKPFDVYSQMRFIDKDFWRQYGLSSYYAFKTYFAAWAQCQTREGKRFPKLIEYQNLDQLTKILAGAASRISKEDALPDLPQKAYVKLHHELSAEQRRVYEALIDEYRTEIEKGVAVTVANKLVLLLRLQQVVCGYVPTDDGSLSQNPHVFEKNPRLDIAREWLNNEEEQAVIYSRFQYDVTQLTSILGDRCVRYDGLTSNDERRDAQERFRAGDVQFFVGNPACAGTGLNLQCARKMLYYSNSFNLVHRCQSEDRIHRSGQTARVVIGDIVGTGTVDETRIIPCLREKKDIAAALVGDDPREWI